MTDNSDENVGLTLKSQREKLGYSLESAAQHTRIRKAHLESIEKNQFSDLPGQVYVTGFIRVYSRYLGLDSNILLSQLEEIRKDDVCSSLEPGAVTRIQSRRSGRSFGGSGRNAFILGLFIVLFVCIAIYFFSVNPQDDDSGEVASRQSESAKDSGPMQGEAATEQK